MNENRIPKKILNIRVKGKFPRERPISKLVQQIRKDVTQQEGRKEEHGKKLRRRCGKTDTDGKAWSSDDSQNTNVLQITRSNKVS
jgi:hypothetical protein